jgi:hypothetical protein
VTYQHNTAWNDLISLAAAADLEDHHASLRRRADVYTPEAMVDGKPKFTGSDKAG